MIPGREPRNPRALESSPLKSVSKGISSPPVLPKTAIAACVCIAGFWIPAIRSASNFICSVGESSASLWYESPKPRSVSSCALPATDDSAKNRFSLLIVGPTASADDPASSKAFSKRSISPALAPVRLLKSSSLPPIANALPNASTAALAPKNAVATPAIGPANLAKDEAMPATLLLKDSTPPLNPVRRPCSLSTVFAKDSSFAANVVVTSAMSLLGPFQLCLLA